MAAQVCSPSCLRITERTLCRPFLFLLLTAIQVCETHPDRSGRPMVRLGLVVGAGLTIGRDCEEKLV